MMSIDITNAYNSVDLKKLYTILEEYNFCST